MPGDKILRVTRGLCLRPASPTVCFAVAHKWGVIPLPRAGYLKFKFRMCDAAVRGRHSEAPHAPSSRRLSRPCARGWKRRRARRGLAALSPGFPVSPSPGEALPGSDSAVPPRPLGRWPGQGLILSAGNSDGKHRETDARKKRKPNP